MSCYAAGLDNWLRTPLLLERPFGASTRVTIPEGCGSLLIGPESELDGCMVSSRHVRAYLLTTRTPILFPVEGPIEVSGWRDTATAAATLQLLALPTVLPVALPRAPLVATATAELTGSDESALIVPVFGRSIITVSLSADSVVDVAWSVTGYVGGLAYQIETGTLTAGQIESWVSYDARYHYLEIRASASGTAGGDELAVIVEAHDGET